MDGNSDSWAQVLSTLIGSATTITLAVLTNRWANARARRKYNRDEDE